LGGNDNTQFNFAFLWQNDNDYEAVVNVLTALILDGSCEVQAAPGFFSGDTTDLYMNTHLSLLQLWNQGPDAYQPLDSQSVLHLNAQGGGIFGLGGSPGKPEILQQAVYDLSYSSLLVPPRESAVFEVDLAMSYSSGDLGNLSNWISVNSVSGNSGFLATCPVVFLELLTAPPTAARVSWPIPQASCLCKDRAQRFDQESQRIDGGSLAGAAKSALI
jgi:hypothetical protein